MSAITIGDLLENEKRLLRIESALDRLLPNWRESQSDPKQLADLRAMVESCGRLSVVRDRQGYPKVTDLDWRLIVG